MADACGGFNDVEASPASLATANELEAGRFKIHLGKKRRKQPWRSGMIWSSDCNVFVLCSFF